MIRGTRLLIDEEAEIYSNTCAVLRSSLRELGYKEVILPSLWDQATFVEKAGPEVLGQMYTFKDKGDRDICLIPECTALIQKMWNEEWKNKVKHPYKIFYIQRCYRYERPQAGRYREFTQAGVEILGNKSEKEDAVSSLRYCLDKFNIDPSYTLNESIKRGLSYYVEDGFEVEVEKLGAQKQIAGGGRYKEGIGWAIGVDRLILTL